MALDLDTLTDDTIIERLSWRPPYIVHTMLPLPEPIKSVPLTRTLTSSSRGTLDTLTIELLHIILSLVDFQSLSRFTRVCHQAKTTVESLPSYHAMMKHASTALVALSRTELITFHTAATVHAALLSDKCLSCQKYGAFLFLPTCERCCHECLITQGSLRVITIRKARTYFGVSRKNLRQIPTMLSMAMTSYVTYQTHPTRLRLVSVKQARKLGISVHGSQEAMEGVGVSKLANTLGPYHMIRAQRLVRSDSD